MGRKALGIMLSFILASCQPDNHDRDVRSELLQMMREFEARATYQEVLPVAQLARHEQSLELIRDKIPRGYPEPLVLPEILSESAYNPSLVIAPQLTREWADLGQKLFEDEALSYSPTKRGKGELSCQSCHLPSLRFTDGLALSRGVMGDLTHRNSPTLFNVAYLSTLTWANPVFPVLEMQARIPLFGDDPVEMGQKGREAHLFSQLFTEDPSYQAEFERAFSLKSLEGGRDPRLNYNLITAALGAYQRTLIDFDTRFDRWLQEDGSEQLNNEQMKGLKLFYGLDPLRSGERLMCAQCHGGILMTDSFQYVREATFMSNRDFHNTGLYNLDGRGAYPAQNRGFASELELEQHPELMGRMRTPPLRFVAETAPYGHDGSFATLESVIDHYAAGGRASVLAKGPNPYTDELVRSGFRIDPLEKQAIIAFLNSLK